MWSNISFLYNKNWPNHPDIFLVTDEPISSNYPFHIFSFKKEMADRLIKAIEEIHTEYIFLSFDDYYPSKRVNEEAIEELLDILESNDIDYCRIFNEPKVKGKKISGLKYKYLTFSKYYEVNFYPGIWKKASLLELLRSGEDIWKSEARLTRRARENYMKCIYVDNRGIFDFIDVVRKGKYLRSSYHFLKKNNLYISNREKRTIKETLSLNARRFLSDHLSIRAKERLKNIGRKKGRVYYSDYAENDD